MTLRAPLIALAVCLMVVCGALLLGRAIDQQIQQHALITRNGHILDCERITDISGRSFYDSCVPAP